MGIEMPVTKNTRIGDLLGAYPRTSEVFSKYHLGCFVCMGAAMETIEEGALMHGVDADAIVADINQLIAG